MTLGPSKHLLSPQWEHHVLTQFCMCQFLTVIEEFVNIVNLFNILFEGWIKC